MAPGPIVIGPSGGIVGMRGMRGPTARSQNALPPPPSLWVPGNGGPHSPGGGGGPRPWPGCGPGAVWGQSGVPPWPGGPWDPQAGPPPNLGPTYPLYPLAEQMPYPMAEQWPAQVPSGPLPGDKPMPWHAAATELPPPAPPPLPAGSPPHGGAAAASADAGDSTPPPPGVGLAPSPPGDVHLPPPLPPPPPNVGGANIGPSATSGGVAPYAANGARGGLNSVAKPPATAAAIPPKAPSGGSSVTSGTPPKG
jgi:hypothetical protein